MAVHRITEETIKRVSRRRSLFVFVVTFSFVVAVQVWLEGGVSLKQLLVAIVSALVLSVGYIKSSWAMNLVDESSWSIEPVDKALNFQFRGEVASIKGEDIQQVVAKLKKGQVRWFDVYHGEQVTRIRYYERIEELYRHARKIGGSSVLVEERY